MTHVHVEAGKNINNAVVERYSIEHFRGGGTGQTMDCPSGYFKERRWISG